MVTLESVFEMEISYFKIITSYMLSQINYYIGIYWIGELKELNKQN